MAQTFLIFFLPIEEYKCHVMRLVESIAEIMTPLAPIYTVSLILLRLGLQSMKNDKFKQIGSGSNVIFTTLISKKGPIKKNIMYLDAQARDHEQEILRIMLNLSLIFMKFAEASTSV